MAVKVTIDLVNRRIIAKPGVTTLDVEVDLYSDLKEDWLVNAGGEVNFEFPFRTTGGDPLPGTLEVGAYFFLRNDLGWRIRPHEADHELILKGNLYPETDAFPIFVPTLGDFTVLTQIERSSQTQVSIQGSGVTAQDKQDIHDKVWGDLEGSQQLQKSAVLMVSGTVITTAFLPTPTQFESGDVAVAAENHFKGRIILWRTGILAKQATEITAYRLVGGRGHFTVAALTSAPLSGNEFLIV